jgi:hypothetical protein
MVEFLEERTAFGCGLNRSDLVELELQAIEASPAFARAPVMRRLLRFLVDESCAGRGSNLKSYSVAVDGLGKPEDFDAQHDSYPRVQVGRLRKMLDAHYAERRGESRIRFAIPQGNYAVEIFENKSAPETAAETPARVRAPRVEAHREQRAKWKPNGVHFALVAGFAAVVAILTLAPLPWPSSGTAKNGHWLTEDFPVVAIAEPRALDGSKDQRLYAAIFGSKLHQMLSRFEALSVTRQAGRDADYVIETEMHAVTGGTDVSVSVVDARRGVSIWSRSKVLEPTATDELFNTGAAVGELVAAIGQSSGVIHSDQRNKGIAATSPYGCWLKFTDFWRDRDPAHAGAVRDCATSWRRNAPESALPHAMVSWIRLERARTMDDADDRAEEIAAARGEAIRAVELNPNSSLAQFSAMHAALFTDDSTLVSGAARRLQQINPNNPDLGALVGMHRILRGDLAGADQLRAAFKFHYWPSKTYYIGFFFEAVMKGDEAAAADALKRFSPTRPAAFQALAEAMVAAKRGQVEQARRHWAVAVSLDSRLGSDPAALFRDWHLAASLQKRSLEWLAPLLQG